MAISTQIHVVLDIDGVLCCSGAKENASFYKEKGAVLSAIKTYYVFPGVIELLQLFFANREIKVSFFSA